MTQTYNLGDLFDLAADSVADRTALVWDRVRLSYKDLRERTDRLAAALARRGVRRGQTVGLLMYNCPAYVESLLAAFKLGAIPFNINYRYGAEELRYVLRDARTEVLIHGAEFEPIVKEALAALPPLVLRVVVEEEEPFVSSDSKVVSYAAALTEAAGDADIRGGRSGDDRLLLYTGGTTGMPKGVEWSHVAKFFAAFGGGGMFHTDGPITAPDQIAERTPLAPPLVVLTLSPLMHGAALWTAMIALLNGQTLVLKNSRTFNGELVWELIEREHVNALGFTGDAMAIPMLEAWDANPGRWDVSSLLTFSWGGAPVSQHLQQALAARFPNVLQMSSLGSSESGMIGRGSLDCDDGGMMRLASREDLAVIVDGERFAQPGEMGILARTGHLPSGYWGDPKKTAETFITLGGRRWVLTGDQVRLDADGSMVLFGRGSTCINTGGEKVFPEEVEAVIRSHPAVRDALVVGVPDPRWGETVAAIVALRPGKSITLDELRGHCDRKLAGFKQPRKLFIESEVRRSPAGKADYRWAKAVATDVKRGLT